MRVINKNTEPDRHVIINDENIMAYRKSCKDFVILDILSVLMILINKRRL